MTRLSCTKRPITGILSTILGRIFARAEAAATPDAEGGTIVAGSTGGPPAMSSVDVMAMLEAKAAQAGQTLNWKTSIVDLMKRLDIDSSLDSRKALAQELGYTGAMNGSAEMNMWLHRQVMAKIAENGGQVPASLRD